MQDKWRGEVVELSWEPRAFLFKKFMTDEECDSVIKMVSYCQAPLLRPLFIMLEVDFGVAYLMIPACQHVSI